MGNPVFLEEDMDTDLADLDLDIRTTLTGDAMTQLRPMMATHLTCDPGTGTMTSCQLTRGCNPPCC